MYFNKFKYITIQYIALKCDIIAFEDLVHSIVSVHFTLHEWNNDNFEKVAKEAS